MTKGNLVVFKGDSNRGKTQLALSTIRQFVQENPDKHRAVYVGVNSKVGEELIASIQDDKLRRRVMSITTD